MRLLRAADRTATAWKNGGGVTREVIAFPMGAGMDAFDWRISIADVTSPGPFSLFKGIDRVLTVLEGRLSLDFVEEGRNVTLDAGQPLAFQGDAPIYGVPVGGPVRDFNVMVRRNAWRAHVEAWRPDMDRGGTRIALATAPSSTLDLYDALLLDPGEKPPDDFTGCIAHIHPVR
jgi:environmental stress-induced protein Ves